MKFSLTSSVLCASALFASANAQAGPNTLAVYHPNIRTQSQNATYLIVPVDKITVQKAVGQYKLLPVPTSDKTLFPHGFPAGKHPVTVGIAYGNDIRMASLEIDSLMSGMVQVPFVDRLGNGKTPFSYILPGFIGGTDGQDLMGVVPALVGSLEGNTLYEGSFMPDTAASTPLGNGQSSSQVKQVIVPNPISGPGVVPSALDMVFSAVPASKALYTQHTFHSILNQPNVLNNGMCQRNNIYYNESFAQPILRSGHATLYSPPMPAGFAGVYKGLGGFSANGELVGYNPQDCKQAAAQNDPKASR